MANNEFTSPIPARLKNVAKGGHVAGADQIIDDASGLTINELVGNKDYSPADYSGMGRVVLKKNIVNGVNTLTQDMFYKGESDNRVPNTNTIYVIQYDFTLREDITIPDNCVLQFEGGSVSGAYTLIGNNTDINAGLLQIFTIDVIFAGSWNISESYPEWFGAKGDGVTDDTLAIQRAIDLIHVNSYINRSVKFQGKTYCVVNNVFVRNYSIKNIEFKGVVKNVTALLLKTQDQEAWFFNASQKMQLCVFENIGFKGDNFVNSNGFKIYSTGYEKQFTFINCELILNTIVSISGTGNGDLSVFDRCALRGKTILELDNTQSVTHRFINCAFTVCGDGFKIKRGGDVFITNANIETHNVIHTPNGEQIIVYDDAEASVHSIVHYLDDVGNGNSLFVISNSRVELHNHGIFATLPYKCMLTLNSVSIASVDLYAGVEHAFELGNGAVLNINNSTLNRNTKIKFSGERSTTRNVPNAIIRNSNIDTDNYGEIAISENEFYRLIIRDCVNITGASPGAVNINFDSNPTFNNLSALPVYKKLVAFNYINLHSFLNGGSSSATVLLPHYNLITSIIVLNKGNGSADVDRTLEFVGIKEDLTETSLFTVENINPTIRSAHSSDVLICEEYKNLKVSTNISTAFLDIMILIEYI